MATLSTNKWYNRYLSEVADSRLELPAYKKNDDSSIKIYYGELFCRVPDCSKAQKKYTTTNNLRAHIETHEAVKLQEGNTGGRVAQKIVNKAVKWYKGLFTGVGPQGHGEISASADSSSEHSVSVDARIPLPVKKDGTVHITNMRKKVLEMGYQVPCDSCGNRNECCKDINKCDYFILFECGNIRPGPSRIKLRLPASA